MFNRNGRKATRQRRLAFIAGTAFAVSATAFSATAEAPAHAEVSVPQPAFDQAFAPFELTDAEAQPSAETIAKAEARFAEAPVEEIEPEQLSAGSAIGSGNASYYGTGFAGRPTASGERFNPSDLTAAHRTLPFGTMVKVTNASNGRSVIVRINDRGPFHGGRVIDLSREAARQIGLIQRGHGQVQLATLAS